MYEYEIIEKFSRPLTIRLKNIKQYGFDRIDRTGVFYVEPEYDGEDIVDVQLFFTGNAYSRGDIVFTQDHFSFVVIRERDGVYFVDEQEVQNSFATESIKTLASLGILRGRPNGHFDPREEMDRTHFAIGLNNTMGRIEGEYNNNYDDVGTEDYYAGPIASLDKVRVNDSFNQTNFGVFVDGDPAMGRRKVKRKEVAVFMSNAYEYSSRVIDGLRTLNPEAIDYIDLDSTSSHERDAISMITEVGLMQGYIVNGQRYYDPEGVLTREQCAIVFHNFLKLYNRALTQAPQVTQPIERALSDKELHAKNEAVNYGEQIVSALVKDPQYDFVYHQFSETVKEDFNYNHHQFRLVLERMFGSLGRANRTQLTYQEATELTSGAVQVKNRYIIGYPLVSRYAADNTRFLEMVVLIDEDDYQLLMIDFKLLRNVGRGD